VLVPALVLEGQVWRLFTWVFFEQDPIGLVFAILAPLFAKLLQLAIEAARILVP